MRWLVLGAGALGGFFGAKLVHSGADVTFLVRPKRALELQRDGLVVTSQDWEIRTPVKTIQQGQSDAPFDVILLSCKAYDLDDANFLFEHDLFGKPVPTFPDHALAAIAPAVGPESVILPMLNGMRHVDLLKDRFGADKVLGGLVAVNAVMLADGSIQQTPLRIPMAALTLGELDGRRSGRCEAIRATFAKSDIACEISDDILSRMWMKFVVFASGAAVASLTRSRAGIISRTRAAPAFIASVIDECTMIAAAEGFSPPAEAADIIRSFFASPTSTYGPSLLVDMEEGRTTEGDHTIGDMVRRAVERGIPCPVLTAALCNLQAYEIGRVVRSG